jgi:hypothetical protein
MGFVTTERGSQVEKQRFRMKKEELEFGDLVWRFKHPWTVDAGEGVG